MPRKWITSNMPLVIASLCFCNCASHECGPFSAKCDGNISMTCLLPRSDRPGPDNEYYWDRVDCGSTRHCKVVGTTHKTSICSLSDNPDPLCLSLDRQSFCHQGKIVLCKYGYRVYETDCGPTRCIGPGPATTGAFDYEPFCALSGSQQMKCPKGLLQQICFENSVVYCKEGSPAKKRACETGNYCVNGMIPNADAVLRYRAFCHWTNLKDNKCPTNENGLLVGTYCDGSTLFHCYLGYSILEQKCKTCGTKFGKAFPECIN